MDFFQAQENALKKTKTLVFYYLVAVILIIVAIYFAVTAGFVFYDVKTRPPNSPVGLGIPLWSVERFIATAVAVILTVGLGSLYKIMALRGGGAAVATSLGGERIDRSTRNQRRRQLLNIVEEMAIASGVPVPEVYILSHEQGINAFAAGWGQEDAVIAVSAGALQELSRDELQGVVAHEYSHVLHGDCRLNIRLMGVLFGIMMLSVFGRMMQAIIGGGGRRGGRGVILVGGGRSRGGSNKSGGGALVIAVILVIVLVTIVGYIGTFFGRLIQAAISRQREFLADAAAVQFTRNPEGIGGALKKIAGHVNHSEVVHPHASEAAHMFFADGLARSFSSVFSTHPPLVERIQRIAPNWDGELKSSKSTRRESRSKAAAPIGDVPPIAEKSGMEKLQGMVILGAVGTMSTENLATAKRITSEIPDAFDVQMREPEGARHSILGLLLVDNEADDAEQWQILEKACGEDEIPLIKSAAAVIEAVPREARLAILELASTTLAQTQEFDRESFYELVDELIHADEHVTPYEYCMRRIVQERLKRGSELPDKGSVASKQMTDDLALAIGLLLSVVAKSASSELTTEELVVKSLDGLYLLKSRVAYHSEEVSLEQLDNSFDLLNGSAFAIRAQFLRAVVACINEDGQLSAEEAEILRMICLSLNCPVPPLGI